MREQHGTGRDVLERLEVVRLVAVVERAAAAQKAVAATVHRVLVAVRVARLRLVPVYNIRGISAC